MRKNTQFLFLDLQKTYKSELTKNS